MSDDGIRTHGLSNMNLLAVRSGLAPKTNKDIASKDKGLKIFDLFLCVSFNRSKPGVRLASVDHHFAMLY